MYYIRRAVYLCVRWCLIINADFLLYIIMYTRSLKKRMCGIIAEIYGDIQNTLLRILKIWEIIIHAVKKQFHLHLCVPADQL